jgi:hypothetical protein
MFSFAKSMFNFPDSDLFGFEARPIIGLPFGEDLGTNPTCEDLVLIVGLL